MFLSSPLTSGRTFLYSKRMNESEFDLQIFLKRSCIVLWKSVCWLFWKLHQYWSKFTFFINWFVESVSFLIEESFYNSVHSHVVYWNNIEIARCTCISSLRPCSTNAFQLCLQTTNSSLLTWTSTQRHIVIFGNVGEQIQSLFLWRKSI